MYQWNEVYDFLEFTVEYFSVYLPSEHRVAHSIRQHIEQSSSDLGEEINAVLQREVAGYRLIGGKFSDITSAEEINTLQGNLQDSDFPGVRQHLQRALALYSDRAEPDSRNSIKESISAVESIVKIIAEEPKAKLGDALSKLEDSGKLHRALKAGFKSLYGYTSDESGIRHAVLQESEIYAEDARFFLISCSAFANYLKSKIQVKAANSTHD